MKRLRWWVLWQVWRNGGPRERVVREIAWRLPRSIAYWAFVRVAVHHMPGSPDERTVAAAAQAWTARP